MDVRKVSVVERKKKLEVAEMINTICPVVSWSFYVLLLLVEIGAGTQVVHAESQSPDWWKAEREVIDILFRHKTNFVELVGIVSAPKPETAQQAMFKLNVLMRGGMNKEGIGTLRELKELCPNLENHQVVRIYYTACDNFSSWELAQAVVERFAKNIDDINLENRLLKHLKTIGWTVEDIDRWLAGMSPGRNNFWVKERLRFNIQHGRGESLVQELSANVRRNPQDTDTAIGFLDALNYSARHTDHKSWDLSWMAEIVKPRLATEARDIASRLKDLSNWTTATTFYSQAIQISLTDQEIHRLGMMCSVFVGEEKLRGMFAVVAREEMAECLLKLGRTSEAQKWMVEAADIRKNHDLGLNALFSGQVQAASGQRIIEERIKDQQNKSLNNPEYWRERALYYLGRKETAQAEDALKKGLALTQPQSEEPEHHSREHIDWRSEFLRDYTFFLSRENRTQEAVSLLRKEIEQSPANSHSSVKAANLLAFDFAKSVSASDEALWNWLSNRQRWENTEERLLWRMLENANSGDLDRLFLRAEGLAKGKDCSRAHTLGWIMNRMGFSMRSIPLLRYAVDKANDEDMKERAWFTLFESYLDTGDWIHAEDLFPNASKRLTASELSEWYSRIAVAAAKAGAKVDAVRIWKMVANVNPSERSGLEDLIKAGLRNDLVVFYLDTQRNIPTSEALAAILKNLGEK